jgi:hypothetical protein
MFKLLLRNCSIPRRFQSNNRFYSQQQQQQPFLSNIDKLKSKYDVVIVGAGHNGKFIQ